MDNDKFYEFRYKNKRFLDHFLLLKSILHFLNYDIRIEIMLKKMLMIFIFYFLEVLIKRGLRKK